MPQPVPEGFQLDQSPSDPPEGFELDGEGDRGTMAFVNRQIANILGGPVDLVNAGLGAVGVPTSDTPVGGSASIAGGMETIQARVAEPDAQPETAPEYIGRGLGDAAGMLVPMGVGLNALSRTGGTAGRVGQAMRAPFARTGKRATAAELAAGAGFGAGEAAADQMAPDNQVAQALAGIGGGVIGGMGPAGVVNAGRWAGNKLPVARRVTGAAKAAVAPFTQAGGMERARNRVQGLAEDPDLARQRLREPTMSELSPATRTGDRRLMGLERSARNDDPVMDAALREQESRAGRTLREDMRAPAQGQGAEQAREFVSDRVRQTVERMRTNLSDATERAQRRIERLQPQRRQSESSTIMREELDSALRQARSEETTLWNAVPDDVQVPTQNARQAFRTLVEQTPRAQRDDLPAKATRFLSRESNERFGDAETVAEMHGLYSTLRESARTSRAAGNLNEARISDMIADAVMEDIGGTAGNVQGRAGQAMREAIDYSRNLNETFRRGNVGKVMGFAREGGPQMAPEMTLDSTVGRGGIRGAVSADELRAATQGAENAEEAMRDYMIARFRDQTDRRGQFDVGRGETFLRQNDELLDRMPTLKREMQDAVDTQSRAQSLQGRTERRTSAINDPRRSAAARFLNAAPEEEIRALQKSNRPAENAREIMRQVSRDETGDAVRGLKGALFDELMEKSGRGFDEAAGEQALSGSRLRRILDDNRLGAVAREILDEDEMAGLRQAADELNRLEISQGNDIPSAGAIMNDAPNMMVHGLANLSSVLTGGKVARATGAGQGGALMIPQWFSARMKNTLGRLTNDRAESLIREALSGDKDLLEALLTPGGQITRQQENRIIETVIGAGAAASSPDEENEPLRITVDNPSVQQPSGVSGALMRGQSSPSQGSAVARALAGQ